MPDGSPAAVVVGNRIKEQRTERNLSIRALAAKAGIHHSYLRQIESGERNPTLLTVLSIAEALGIDAGGLLAGLKASGASA